MVSTQFCFLILASLLLLVVSNNDDGIDGWRRQDRFIGFRFELTPSPTHSNNEDIKELIRDKADELFCFGWVQNATLHYEKETLVGEARCKKSVGKAMTGYLTSLADGGGSENAKKQIKFREYDDTLIKLHFSHFKIVSPGRSTCFLEEPNKCRHLYYEREDSTPIRYR